MNRKHPIAALLCVLLLLFNLTAVTLAEEEDMGDPVPVTFTTLKTGDTGEMVNALQERLAEVGYLAAVSSVYDKATADAVTAVQTNYGLPETGIADDETQEVIFGECYLPLKEGDAGEQVTALQTRLKENSLYSGETSGTYDMTTKQAVSMFQQLPSRACGTITEEHCGLDDKSGTRYHVPRQGDHNIGGCGKRKDRRSCRARKAYHT